MIIDQLLHIFLEKKKLNPIIIAFEQALETILLKLTKLSSTEGRCQSKTAIHRRWETSPTFQLCLLRYVCVIFIKIMLKYIQTYDRLLLLIKVHRSSQHFLLFVKFRKSFYFVGDLIFQNSSKSSGHDFHINILSKNLCRLATSCVH